MLACRPPLPCPAPSPKGDGPLHQPSLFDDGPDPQRARRARDEGIGAAAAHAHPVWQARAREAIRHCAVACPDGFTADHVLAYMASNDVATIAKPALGPVFLAAARDQEIEKTGEYWPSTIPRRHRDLTVWRAR